MRTLNHELGDIHVLESGDDAAPVWDLLNARAPISYDTEGTGLDVYATDYAARLFQIGTPDTAYVMPVAGREALVRDLVEAGPVKWAHNRTYDGLALERSVGSRFMRTASNTLDTGILSRLLDPRSPKHGGAGHSLDALGRSLLGIDDKGEAKKALMAAGRKLKIKAADIWRDIPADDEAYLRYAGGDVMLTSRLAGALSKAVLARGLEGLAQTEHEIDYKLAHITRRGMALDVPYTENVRDRYLQEHSELEMVLKERFGITPTASGAYSSAKASLIERVKALGVDPWPRFTTKKGAEALDKDGLAELARRNDEAGELARVVVQAKKAHHYGDGYASGFLAAVGHDGRVHPTVNPLAAATGRMSVSNPPLQQVPKDDAMIRGCFVADEGHTLIAADYAQVEFRVAAAVSKDESMRAAILNGEDLHERVARQLYGDEWAPKRDVAKAAGFGRLFGAGPPTIAKQTGVSESVARSMVKAFDETYPGVARLDRRLRNAVANGQTVFKTVTGRPLIVDQDRPHSAINYMIQSPARDVFAQGVCNLFDAGLGDALRLVVHDEVVLSVPTEDVEEASRTVEECLSMTFLGIPIETDAQVLGERWRKA